MTSFDPNHWQCCPEYTPPVHPPGRNPQNKYEGHTNTSVKTVKVAQDFYGILHPHVVTGYKMIGASGSKPVFDDLTTNQFFQNKTRKVGEETGHMDKKLCPYKPDATRNRPRSDWQTDVGLQNFDRRNASYLRLEDGALGSQFMPKTTSQSFFTPPPKGDPPGTWHQGICRDRAVYLHKKQMEGW
ncbi:unnamed protein product [Calypogeia fissa]